MQPENTNKKGVAWSLEPPLFPSFPFWKEGGSGDVVVMNLRIKSNGLVITQWKGLFNISEYFVSSTSSEFTPTTMAMTSYSKKQTKKRTKT